MSPIDPSTLRFHREALKARLEAIGPYSKERFAGRGIVICAGGSRMFTNAYVLIWVLRRRLASELPIQVWHLGPDEVSPAMSALLEGLEVEVVDAMVQSDPVSASIRDGWQLKAYALLRSRFREVLLLDCDQVPVRDPQELFSWREYESKGAVFWPDIVDLSAENPIWDFCGVRGERRPSLESGQLVVDKARHWSAVNAAAYLNEHADVFYRLIYGDKDTFLAAWLATKSRFALVPHRPFIDERCLFQRDFRGKPLFQHRTGAKWEYAKEQRTIPGFEHFDACLEALAELCRQWSGRIFRAPSRSLRARQIEAELTQRSGFLLRRPSQEDHPLRLRLHGELSEGRTPEIQHWFVRDDGDALELVLHDGSCETYRLRALEGGIWGGAALTATRGEAHLVPVNERRGVAVEPAGELSLVSDILRSELSSGAFDGARARRLETTFEVLAGADPAIVRDLHRAAQKAGRATPLGSFLSALAERLGSEAESRRPRPVERNAALLSDRHRYQWL
jgi:hypothetical protein